MASQERKGTSIPDVAPSPRSSRAVDAEKETHESEAQSRGIYAPSRSRNSNAVHVGGYELKRRQGDEETDRSPKRSRGDEDDRDRLANRTRNAEEDEPVRASDDYRPPCKNYMCMGDHSYEDCDKPKICWGCRSTKHYWSFCPTTCTRCGAKRHTAKYCEDFDLSPSGISHPHAYNVHPPTEPVSHRARKESLEHAHGEDSLPARPEKIVLPNHHAPKKASEDASLRASHTVLDPNFNNARRVPQQSRPTHRGASLTDRPLQGVWDPERSSSPRLRKTGTPRQLTISTQAPGELTTPPSAQPGISPLDPRLRRSSGLTPLVSSQISLEPGEVPSVESQILGEPPSKPSQHRPLGVSATPSQAPVRQEQHPSQASGQREAYVPPTSSRKEDHHTRVPSQKDEASSRAPTRNQDSALPASTPNEHSAADSLDTLQARMKVFEEEERVKQKEHEEELARKAHRQKMEYEHELEEKLNQKKHDADMARRAAVQKQEEEHERRLAELRRL